MSFLCNLFLFFSPWKQCLEISQGSFSVYFHPFSKCFGRPFQSGKLYFFFHFSCFISCFCSFWKNSQTFPSSAPTEFHHHLYPGAMKGLFNVNLIMFFPCFQSFKALRSPQDKAQLLCSTWGLSHIGWCDHHHRISRSCISDVPLSSTSTVLRRMLLSPLLCHTILTQQLCHVYSASSRNFHWRASYLPTHFDWISLSK